MEEPLYDEEMGPVIGKLDPDNLSDFSDTELIPKIENVVSSMVGIYRTKCHELQTVPISVFLDQMNEPIINLKHYGLNALDVEALTHVLSSVEHISQIFLDGNHIGKKGADCVANLIQTHPNLNLISLSQCNLLDSDEMSLNHTWHGELSMQEIIGKDGKVRKKRQPKPLDNSLLRTIATDTNLQTVCMSSNDITDRLGAFFFKSASENRSIKVLEMSNNKLSFYTAAALMEFLATNTSLNTLNLHGNNFGIMNSMEHIGTGLSNNSTIEYLDLSENNIKDEHVVRLFHHLNGSGTLRVLNLTGNKLKMADWRPYENYFANGCRLEELQLRYNELSSQSISNLMCALVKHPDLRLTLLDLRNACVVGAKLTEPGREAYDELSQLFKILVDDSIL
ncbi:hypothetical protein PCE1_001740 [Barthelona sp. PCE]